MPLGEASGMWRMTGGLWGRAKQQVIDDLKADPYLPYILVLAAVFAMFWFWHRIPNFATRDERWRINNVMVAVGFYVENPTLDSFLRGIAWGRPYGAVFYLYAIALIPVFVAAYITGQLDVFTALPKHQAISLWAHWQRLPEWIWTWSILLTRLANIMLSVGCVYVTYRIGTEMRDRSTGRLAAVLMTFTWGFLIMTHEVGPAIPMLFFWLLVIYFSLHYSQTGDRATFLAGCVCGGVAIAFKLTAGVSVFLLGIAYLLYGRNADTEWRTALVRPGLIVIGAILGAVVIIVGYPSVFSGGIDRLTDRILRGSTRTQPHNWRAEPSWWWILRGYLNGLGLPLFIAVLGGVVGSIPQLRERSPAADGIVLSIAGIVPFILVYARWSYVRTHHLLPTFPLLILILVVTLRHLDDHRRTLARPLIAVLLVTSGLYAGIGVLGYATQPQDEATEWLQMDASENTTIETYIADPQESAVPHEMTVIHPNYGRMTVTGQPANRQAYTDWIRAMPQRCPTYIELTTYNSLLYLAPDYRNRRTEALSAPHLTDYYSDLLAEDTYPYTVVAMFGPRPQFLDREPQHTWLPELLRVGVFPRTVQYGDPQDFGISEYTVILKRTGRCNPS
jgi:hypothetical protein